MFPDEYVCNYLISPGRTGKETYYAASFPEAARMHRENLPQYRYKVIDWTGPEGLIPMGTIPPQLETVYTWGPAGEPVDVAVRLDTEGRPVPPGHQIEWRNFLGADGLGWSVTWFTLSGSITHLYVSADVLGMYHFDMIGHDPFSCTDCPVFSVGSGT